MEQEEIYYQDYCFGEVDFDWKQNKYIFSIFFKGKLKKFYGDSFEGVEHRFHKWMTKKGMSFLKAVLILNVKNMAGECNPWTGHFDSCDHDD